MTSSLTDRFSPGDGVHIVARRRSSDLGIPAAGVVTGIGSDEHRMHEVRFPGRITGSFAIDELERAARLDSRWANGDPLATEQDIIVMSARISMFVTGGLSPPAATVKSRDEHLTALAAWTGMAPDALLKHLTPAIGAHLFDFRDRRLATLFPVATVIGDISSPLEAQSLLIDILASRERGLDRAGPATDPRLGDRQMQLLGVELLELLSAWYGGSPAEVHHGVQPALDRLTRTDVAVMPGLRAPTASRLDTPAGGGPRTSHAPGGFPVDRPHLPPPRRTGPRP